MTMRMLFLMIAAAASVANAGTPPERWAAGTPLIGEGVARSQWDMAENRTHCAPLALLSDGGARGKARPASFGGGWAVAFDLPGVRSAYGFAGTGLLPQDQQPAGWQRDRLTRQWPHLRDLGALPAPSFAGYGVVGAEPYPMDNPAGDRLHSLAYLRVGGQRCTYNVWSRVSRAHLETLLDNLRLID